MEVCRASQNTLERKGILSFLIITFAIMYLIEGILILSGFRFTSIPGMFGQIVVSGAMRVPTFAALITVKFVTHERPAIGNFRLGPWKSYVAAALVLPMLLILAVVWVVRRICGQVVTSENQYHDQ